MKAGWKINKSKPVSLDYVNPMFGYIGNSVTGTAYYVLLDEIRCDSGLQHWLEHLREKAWFDESGFMIARKRALEGQSVNEAHQRRLAEERAERRKKRNAA
jgi:hypothetical protein